MIEVLWLGILLGAGAALSVGPVFVTILQTAAARGSAPASGSSSAPPPPTSSC